MTFIVRQISLKSDGSEIIRQTDFSEESIYIGRNSDNAIHLPDLAVNPVHAVVRSGDPQQLVIESTSGQPFDVDGSSTTSATIDLTRGAELRFGGHIINVGIDDSSGHPSFTVRRTEAVSDSAEEKDTGFIYTLHGLLPGKRLSAWGFVALVLIACLAWPIYTYATYKGVEERPAGFHADEMWISGDLSLAHKSLSGDCQACHVDAFVSVRDDACLTCHTDDAHDHAPIDKQLVARGEPQGFAKFTRFVAASFNKPEGSCVECHTEHEGAGAMQPTRQQFCADCHDGMDTRLEDTELMNAADFGNSHPQFRPLLLVRPLKGSDEKAPRQRISLDKKPTENNGIKFPHDLHLNETGGVAQMGRRLAGKYGFGQSLVCADCHTPDQNEVRFQPVNMEKSCSMCHSLAFDNIGGTFRTLRHGEPEMVRADLRAFYRSTAPNRPINLGSLARQRPGEVNSRRTAEDYARAVNFRGTRADQAIRQVFSRGGACFDCHNVTAPSSRGGVDFGISPVAQTDRYMHKGWFSHKAHNDEDCSTCHVAKESDQASDLLIPGIKVCRDCHVGESGATLAKVNKPVESTCAMCHDYHADDGAPWLMREGDKKKTVTAGAGVRAGRASASR